MKKHLIIIHIVLALVACQRTQTFTINGNISNADGETLYLEHTALLQTSTIDSCTLNARGNFSLKAAAPTYPDFYRLRVGGKSLILAIPAFGCATTFDYSITILKQTKFSVNK